MSFWDQVQETADNAPEAGFPQLQYGKLTITPLVVKWQGKGKSPVITEMAEGQALKDRETLRLRFAVDIQEFNPQLEFEWFREVDVAKTRNENNKTDWSETVLPSLMKVFGEKWAQPANGCYVEVEDVPSVRGTYKNDAGETKQLNTIKVLRKFDSKEACLAARNETYKPRDNGNDGDLPAEVVEVAKTLYQSINENDDIFRQVAGNDDKLKNYDVEALLAVAK